jgi:hypothetical protein
MIVCLACVSGYVLVNKTLAMSVLSTPQIEGFSAVLLQSIQ